MARTGRADCRLEFRTVKALRQLSAIQPGAARCSRGLAAANVARAKETKLNDFMVVISVNERDEKMKSRCRFEESQWQRLTYI